MIRKKETKGKPGAPSDNDKNPFLNAKGGLDLIEKFPGIDYMPYVKKQIKKSNKIRR